MPYFLVKQLILVKDGSLGERFKKPVTAIFPS